jgi:Heterokaryon incompatibility protein (HET)
MSTLKYTYTSLTSVEFRLVLLHRSGATSPAKDLLSIEFVSARFDQESSYTALSYAWGTDSGVEDIQVKDKDLRTLPITKSLACALRSLRRSEDVVLWIDALCIDQGNKSEKSQQIRRMAEIYRKATEVIIWLGEAANDSDLGMEFIMNMSVNEIDRLAASPEYSKAWIALANLMQRSWFTRRWVIQEVAFARHPVLRCGSASVPWARFCEAVELFTEKSDEIRQCIRDNPPENQSSFWTTLGSILCHVASVAIWPRSFDDRTLYHRSGPCLGYDHSSIGELRGVGVHSLIAIYNRVLSPIRDCNEPRRLCTMDELLSYLPEFETKDERDVVFALASLAKDYKDFTTNYDQSVIRVYKKAVQQAVDTSHSLNIICRPWAQSVANLPSWVLPRSALPFCRDYQGIYIRQHADPLVCLGPQRNYHASGSDGPSTCFNDDETHFVLACKGIQLPSIAWIGDKAGEGRIPSLWSNSFKEAKLGRKYLEEMYWRTLVVDRDPIGNPPPHWYSIACNEAYKLCLNGELDTVTLLQGERNDGEQISSKLKEFLARVQATTWNRRLVRLKDGSLGLVPNRTILWDQICILFGCDVPVVLRRLNDNTWKIIGEAFIYGVMDGEAIDRPHNDMCFNLV